MSKHHAPPNTAKASHAAPKALDAPLISDPDQDNFVTSPLFAGTPLEGSRWSFKEVRDRPGQTAAQQRNSDTNDVENLQQSESVSLDTNRFDASWFTQGVNANVPKDDNGNWVKFTDVFVARGAHRDLPAFMVSDLPAAIAYWSQPNKDGSSRWPKIDHPTTDSVAAP